MLKLLIRKALSTGTVERKKRREKKMKSKGRKKVE